MPRGGRMPMRMPMKMNMAFLNAMMANSRRMMPMGRPTAPNMNFPPSMGAGLPSGLMGMMPPNFMGGNTALMGAMMGADIAPYGPDRTVGGVTIDGSDISYGP
ncbi:hypothetical protein SNE40_002655 [Patella caerulea]|uniref:Uncharacterized protein n=1 Tax=Patella caerulea TaxID=87958 RepID=A0AAN8K1H2_PATCE